MNEQIDPLPDRMRRLDENAMREFGLSYGPRLHRLFTPGAIGRRRGVTRGYLRVRRHHED